MEVLEECTEEDLQQCCHLGMLSKQDIGSNYPNIAALFGDLVDPKVAPDGWAVSQWGLAADKSTSSFPTVLPYKYLINAFLPVGPSCKGIKTTSCVLVRCCLSEVLGQYILSQLQWNCIGDMDYCIFKYIPINWYFKGSNGLFVFLIINLCSIQVLYCYLFALWASRLKWLHATFYSLVISHNNINNIPFYTSIPYTVHIVIFILN